MARTYFRWSHDLIRSGTILTNWNDMPKSPSTVNIQLSQIVTESQRTVGKDALLNKELLATKFKLSCTWNYLLPSEMASLLKVGYGKNWFALEFTSPVVPSQKYQGNFYGGDIQMGTGWHDIEGNPHHYTGTTWNFIER